MRAKGVIQFCTPITNYLYFQLLKKVPLNTTLVDEDDTVQPQIYASLLSNRLSVMQHLEPSSAATPPPASPVAIQGTSVVELTACIDALRTGHIAPAPSP